MTNEQRIEIQEGIREILRKHGVEYAIVFGCTDKQYFQFGINVIKGERPVIFDEVRDYINRRSGTIPRMINPRNPGK